MFRKSPWISVAVLILLVTLTGCGPQPEEAQQKPADSSPEMSGVPLTIVASADPAAASPGGNVTVTAEVKQGDRPVAADVEFEIRRSGEPARRLKGSSTETGRYSAVVQGVQPGEHTVIVHVNAPGIHQMETARFTVKGEAQAGHHHHGTELQLDLPDTVTAGQTATLAAKVLHDGKPLSGAETKFEIRTGSGRHHWIPAREGKPGEYSAEFSFPTAGAWSVVLHVEKGSIHDHVERQIQVK
ncbi:FixH family protein [Staphylospora marina]|uniref:FixH family protein n=1 Tax=Staphylospora marina TaxID=2490858 RepID=UPI0013DE1819|nr:FixH family protein [Staphylospora marina]